MSEISIKKFNTIVNNELHFAAETGLYLDKIEHGSATMILPYQEKSTRPGGTISGPSMMMLSDACMYAVVLSMLGEVKLAVTTNLNINFLRKPSNTDLRAEGSIIKLGRRLAIIEVSVFSEDEIVSHATGTYSIPPSA